MVRNNHKTLQAVVLLALAVVSFGLGDDCHNDLVKVVANEYNCEYANNNV